MKTLILMVICAFAFRVIRNGFAIGSYKAWDSDNLSRGLSSLVIALSVGICGHIALVPTLILWGMLWLCFIPGVNPETSVAITGAPDSINQPLQWGIQWLSTKLSLPTQTFWQRKVWGMLYTMIRFSVLIVPFTFLSFAASAPLHCLLGFLAPVLIAGAYGLAGFIPISDQRVPTEAMAGGIIGLISGLIISA